MEVRKLKTAAASGGSTGGNAPTYKPRTTDIFFATAGFVEDFDYYDNVSTVRVSSKIRNSEIYIKCNSNSIGYFGKKINKEKIFCFLHQKYYDYLNNNNNDREITIKIGNVYIYLYHGTNKIELRTGTSIENADTDVVISSKDFTITDSRIIEYGIDVPNKKIILYYSGTEYEFDFSSVELESNLIERVYFHTNSGNDYSSEIAISTNRIKDICIVPMLTNALGDNDDFIDANSTLINKCIPNSYPITASAVGAKQLYKFAVPTLPANSKIDSINFGTSVKGDDINTICNIMKIAETEYQGNALVPNSTNIQSVTDFHAVNPATGEDWTLEDLTDLQAGIKILGVAE